jgi:poly-gamma-glutamate capsule biosynthesis protein CapA/YwtB (metallophosphatase superfamily)
LFYAFRRATNGESPTHRIRPDAIIMLLVVLISLTILTSPAYANWDGGHDVVGCPQAQKTWYFAEGTTREGFNEYLCLLNPNAGATAASVTYMLGTGENVSKEYGLAPNSRTTIDVSADVPAGNDVSVKIEARDPVVAERPVYFRYKGTITGGHDVMGANAPAKEWYFAEGTCRPGFETYLSIQNPESAEAAVKMTYMLGDGDTKEEMLSVAGRSRKTVAVSGTLGIADDTAHDFSCRVETTNDTRVVAERPTYFDYKGWTGGHDVLGANAPAKEWYFAEGTCRPGFESYLCIQNPSAASADVKVAYMLGDGSTRDQSITVSGNSRYTVFVDDVLGRGDDPAHDFSVKVESTNGAGIVAERPMYFSYRGAWTGGHDVLGAAAPQAQWYFAEGTCRPGFDPYITIQNPEPTNATVRLSYMLGDGTSKEGSLTVRARSRATVIVKDALGEANDTAHDFSCKVESTDGTPIVAERPVYFSYASTVQWSLAAVGDVNLGGDMLPILQSNGYGYPWSPTGDLLRSTTLTFANLECAISYRGEPVAGKAFTFRGPPDGLPPMRDAGVDVVSQANNHARDFGAVALTDSLGYLDQNGIAHCGAGADLDSAHAPAYQLANGLRIAFLAYNDIGYDGFSGWPAGPGYPGIADAANSRQMASDIASAKSNADLVVVSFHWGTERKYTPDPRQVDLAHFAIDSGADLVLGGHPHVAQGFSFYKGKLIAYSLGNFVFSPGSAEGHYTILTKLALDSRGLRSATVYPIYINNGRPQLMGGSEGQSLLGQVAGLSNALGTPMTVSNGVATIP